MMRKIIAITQVTLDGVMQSPGGPEEDPRNGFTYGGWAMPFLDDALNQAIGETIAGEFDMLLGRRTYEIFAAYWPNQGDNPIAKAFNKATKYVVTRSLDQLDWENSQHIGGDVVDEVRRLKIGWAGVAYLGQQRIAADADRRRTRRRISHLGLSVGARRRKAAVRKWRPATWSLSGCNAEHAKGRPPQHLPACRSPSKGVTRRPILTPDRRAILTGGRDAVPISGSYMPHLRVGTGEYLGVSFVDGQSTPVAAGTIVEANVRFMYSGVPYEQLKPGVQFQVLEGPRIVGIGVVEELTP
jgi:dihydrofolate reductase